MASQSSNDERSGDLPPARGTTTRRAVNAGTEAQESPRTRARVDDTVRAPGFEVQSPLKVAENHILNSNASLHDGLATLLNEKGKSYLALAHKLVLKKKTLSRMENDEDHIPVSARVDFKLQAWKEAEASHEFTTLSTETALIVKSFQLQLKQKIIENIKLEQSVLTNKLHKDLCEALFAIVEISLVAHGKDPSYSHEMVLAILHQHGEGLLRHLSLSVTEFTVLYRTTLNVPDDVQATAELARPRQSIKRTLESTFVASWDAYLKQQKDNELALSLKKRAREALQSQATEDATMQVDMELPASREQLQSLIQREATRIADKRIGTLHQELASLRKSISAKNVERGQSSSGASLKKKSQGGKKNKKSKKAGARASANNSAANDANSETSIRSEDSDGWTEVSNHRSRQRQSRRADGAGRGSSQGRGGGGRHRSSSRSRNRRGRGGRGNTLPSRA